MSYERSKDTCNLTVLVLPCVLLACVTANNWGAVEVLWTFSEYLEGFAMVPQVGMDKAL